jgi:outer membrane protein assembly factor BamE (lipoprotein component of BamABCDE complex)
MKIIFYSIIVFIFISNCTLNKVTKYHGVHFLEKKHVKLSINTSNKNDIIQLLGPPSTKSTFDKDLWIYIERTTSSSRLSKLGAKKLLKNNILILEIDNKGLLTEKIFLDKSNMNELKFSKQYTKMNYAKKSFIYNFLSGVRKKINDPMGRKNK